MVTCLVCLGFLTMDSSIWVAQMMGLPNMLHSANICFLAINTFSVPSFCQVLDFLLNLNLGDDPDALSLVTQSPIMSLNMNECVIGFQLLWRLWQGRTGNILRPCLNVLYPSLPAGGWPRAEVLNYRVERREAVSCSERLEMILEMYVLKQFTVINSL